MTNTRGESALPTRVSAPHALYLGPAMSQPGIVAIGRNEGERLRLCLESVVGRGHTIVYVDSGSSDGSVGLARSKGVEVVELDLALPFTAARGRNEGFARLEAINPGVRFVQFVDGDCEMVAVG